MNDEFTLKNGAVLKWLTAIILIGAFVVVVFPPAFWLSAVGGSFLVVGILSNSARTNQWMSWQNEGSLNWFEGWAVATGALLAVLPLFAVLVRFWFT